MVTINKLKISPKWKDKVDFEIVPAKSDEGEAAVTRHGWQARHGLELMHGDRALGNLDGHSYGQEQIEALLGKHVR